MQHQVLGSDQWTALVTGLRKPEWAATGLKKGIQHIFRVLSSSGKSSSKPSAPSEPIQLLEHGEPNAVWMGWGRGQWWRLKGYLDSVTVAWTPPHEWWQWSGYFFGCFLPMFHFSEPQLLHL